MMIDVLRKRKDRHDVLTLRVVVIITTDFGRSRRLQLVLKTTMVQQSFLRRAPRFPKVCTESEVEPRRLANNILVKQLSFLFLLAKFYKRVCSWNKNRRWNEKVGGGRSFVNQTSQCSFSSSDTPFFSEMKLSFLLREKHKIPTVEFLSNCYWWRKTGKSMKWNALVLLKKLNFS
jgi:hypothetical protein